VSAVDAWQWIERSYAGRGIGCRLLLRQTFAQLKMVESGNVISLISTVKSTGHEMAANTDSVSHADAAIKLLMGLRNSCCLLIMAIEAHRDQKVTVHY